MKLNIEMVKDVVASEIIHESKLDLTTKILILIFAILMLIVIFAKKIGIKGFP